MSRLSGLVGRALDAIFRRNRQEPTSYRWAYRCYWIDTADGSELTTSYHVVVTDSGTNYQRASYEARREAMQSPPLCIGRMQRGGRGIRLRCQRVGTVVPLP